MVLWSVRTCITVLDESATCKLAEAGRGVIAAVISPLVQIMACRLVGAKPLSEPMLEYC